MSKRWILEEWNSVAEAAFKGMVVSDIQRYECKKMFYAGYVSCMALLRKAGEVDEAEGCKMLDEIETECEKFAEELLLGTYAIQSSTNPS